MKRAILAVCAVVAAGTGMATVALPRLAGGSAAAAESQQPPTAGDRIQPELGLPAIEVVAFGSSPAADPSEIWAYGLLGVTPVAGPDGRSYANQYALLEHTGETGWRVVPLADRDGNPIASTGDANNPAEYGAFAGEATAAGGVVLLSGQNVIVSNPGGEPALAPAPETHEKSGEEETGEEEAHKSGEEGTHKDTDEEEVHKSGEELLGPGESLLPEHPSRHVTLAYAAVEESTAVDGARTGVLIAPVRGRGATLAPGVLHYDGEAWSREPIDAEGKEPEDFEALALSCGGAASAPDGSSPQNCWLLASALIPGENHEKPSLLLYRRQARGSGWEWVRQTGARLFGVGEAEGAIVAALPQGAQMLTATAQGVWVDFQTEQGSGSRDVSEFVAPDGAQVQVRGSWCYPTGSGCESSLGARLPAAYRSFAWPGNGEDLGTRIVTGLHERAMLEFSGGAFTYQMGAGGVTGEAPGGAAFEPPRPGRPQEGWIADDATFNVAADSEGQPQAIKLTPEPLGDQLAGEAVPFRRPLLALAQAPGTSPGDPSAEALALGELGQIARYVPGSGWRSEALYNAAGQAQTPTLLGVAWPEPGRAYAVGDNGTMWLWQASTGLWVPDPAKPPNFIGNLQAIAFEPGHPGVGYAVGRQGVLMKFGKTWEQISTVEQESLEKELNVPESHLNFTSLTFAGGVAMATYRTLVNPAGKPTKWIESGGVVVSEAADGWRWRVDQGAGALLDQLPETERVLSKIAGLPNGQVVAAGPGKVLECESSCESATPWRLSAQPLPEAQNISALAAYDEGGGTLRALVSIDLDPYLDPQHYSSGTLEETPFKVDQPLPPQAGQPVTFLPPDLLPNSGYLLRETPNGWEDVEHSALPAPEGSNFPRDLPERPDPVLALLVSPDGGEGLAVGGQTGDLEGGSLAAAPRNVDLQTASVQRFPTSVASQNGASPAPIPTQPGSASFVIAGQAACAQLCADDAPEELGPDAWLEHALQSAKNIQKNSPGGLRAFLYTGERLPSGGAEQAVASKPPEGLEGFERELGRYAQLLGGGESLPVYAAASEDLTGTSAGIAPFSRALGLFTPGAPAGHAYYSQLSQSPGGTPVEILVMSFAKEELEAGEQNWLAEELKKAKEAGHPAIVMGNESLGFKLPSEDAGSARLRVTLASPAATAAVSRILVEGGALAYFFDYPGANVKASVDYGTRSIPAYGTGTLGYVRPEEEAHEADSLGSSGFLLAEVKTAAGGAAKLRVSVVPNIGQLGLDATNGTLLRRSGVALFEALARRPPGGVAITEGSVDNELSGPDPYDKIPFNCIGANCAYEVPSEYTFTSSNPEVGGFVEHEAASGEALAVQLGANKLPIPDEPRTASGELNPGARFSQNSAGEPVNEKGEAVPVDASGLFCAYNAGTTIVSITTGGLTYSEPVTVQAGSVEYPCGTVPLKHPPPRPAAGAAAIAVPRLAPASSPPPVTPQVQTVPPPPPPPIVAPLPRPHHPRPHPVPPAFVPLLPALALLSPVLVPPPPGVAQPAPPTGTSTAQVTESAVAPQREREEEEAIDIVHNMAAYREEPERRVPAHPVPYYLPIVMLLLAFSAAGLRNGTRWRAPELARSCAERPRR